MEKEGLLSQMMIQTNSSSDSLHREGMVSIRLVSRVGVEADDPEV